MPPIPPPKKGKKRENSAKERKCLKIERKMDKKRMFRREKEQKEGPLT